MSMRRRRSISSSILVIREVAVDDEVTEDSAADDLITAELDMVVVRLSGSVLPVSDSRSESNTEAGLNCYAQCSAEINLNLFVE